MTEITPSAGSTEAGEVFARFVELIARLRAPGGCPWDAEQTHESVKPMTIEEAYEVAHAIDEGDDDELMGELGDLLLQVVFHANIAEERKAFRLRQIIERVSEKMVRRHPHVFANDGASTSGEVLRMSGTLLRGQAFKVALGIERRGEIVADLARGVGSVRERLDEQFTRLAGGLAA